MTNADIAARLLEHARSPALRSQLFRIRSYRQAAFVIQGLDRPVEEMLRERGQAALAELPRIGDHLAFTIAALATTGEVIPYSERKRRRVA